MTLCRMGGIQMAPFPYWWIWSRTRLTSIYKLNVWHVACSCRRLQCLNLPIWEPHVSSVTSWHRLMTHWVFGKTRQCNFVTFEQDRSGRLLKYEPGTQQTTVLARGLYYPNGIAISQDNTFLLLSLTSKVRCRLNIPSCHPCILSLMWEIYSLDHLMHSFATFNHNFLKRLLS